MTMIRIPIHQSESLMARPGEGGRTAGGSDGFCEVNITLIAHYTRCDVHAQRDARQAEGVESQQQHRCLYSILYGIGIIPVYMVLV